MPETLHTFTEDVLDRLAGTLNPEETLQLAAAIHDAYQHGLSVDEFFKWQESGKRLAEFIGMPNQYSYLTEWRKAAVAEDPKGVVCGCCKKDNNWYDQEGWFYWWPTDSTGKPDGLPPVAVCLSCCRRLNIPTTRRMLWE